MPERAAPPPPTAPPLSEYFRWLAGRDREVSLAAWRDALAGVDEAEIRAKFREKALALRDRSL